MNIFKYKEIDCKFTVLSDLTFEEYAKKKNMDLVIVKREQIRTCSFCVKRFATKYQYVSENTKEKVFAYEFIENYGPDGFGAYILTTEADFENLEDIYINLMKWLEED